MRQFFLSKEAIYLFTILFILMVICFAVICGAIYQHRRIIELERQNSQL